MQATARCPSRCMERRRSWPANRNSCASRAKQRACLTQAVLKLSIMPMPRAALPLARGVLSVTEPRYLTLFRDLQRYQLQHPGSKMCFAHLISPASAPPALLATDDSINGPGGPWPKVGCLATITSLQQQENGSMLVGYELSRRFTLLRVDKDDPYPVAYAIHYSDHSNGLSLWEQKEIDDLEQEVYRSLLETEALSRKLQTIQDTAESLSVLPEDVTKYAPPPPSTRTFAQALSDAGYAAGFDMMMWQRQQGAYGGRGSGGGNRSVDPYAHVSEKLGKEQRQELFSFAAASLVDGLGNVECLALLHSQDTAARLRWVAQAIGPYLQELQAKVSVKKALSP